MKRVLAFIGAVSIAAALFGGAANATTQPKSTRLLVFGHSIAYGYGASSLGTSWAHLVSASSCRPLTNYGNGGDLSADTVNVIDHAGPYKAGDVAVIETGINDARLFGADADAVNRYWANISEMLWTLRLPNGTPVPVVLVADPGIGAAGWGTYPPYDRGTQAVADQYASELHAVAAGWPAGTVVDVRGSWSDADISADLVHPDDAGHALIAGAVTAALSARHLGLCR